MDSLKLIWNGALKFFHSDNGGMMNERLSNSSFIFDERTEEDKVLSNSWFFVPVCNSVCNQEATGEIAGSYHTDGGCSPETCLLFALSYMNVQDLLSVEMVSKLSHSTVQGDALLWRDIHIDQPLSERITDDALLRLTNKAQGSLRTLSLVNCSRITEAGLNRVLESNPGLIKLNVPECRLTFEGIVRSLKTFKSASTPGLMQLRIGLRLDVTQRLYDELMSSMCVDDCENKSNVRKPRFFGKCTPPFDDDRAIDIEVCPSCQLFRIVYDCPAESCQGKEVESELCRACMFCIARCVQCGRCVNDEYEGTFNFDPVCSDCLIEVKDHQEGLEGTLQPDGLS